MNSPTLYPLKLAPIPCAKIWGGTRLHEQYGKPIPQGVGGLGETVELSLGACGESMIDSGEMKGMPLGKYLSRIGQSASELPVAVKLIDAREALSVQVHPRKTELWYIIEAEQDAEIIYGLSEDFDRARFESALKSGDISHLLHRERVLPGEFYMLPSGLVHAIGAGVLVAEFQQNNDETLRLYDYGRDRELHTEAALDAIERLGVNKKGDGIAVPGISKCEFFSVEKLDISGTRVISADKKPIFFICADCEGVCLAGERPLSRGDSYFLPCGSATELRGGSMTVLTMTW